MRGDNYVEALRAERDQALAEVGRLREALREMVEASAAVVEARVNLANLNGKNAPLISRDQYHEWAERLVSVEVDLEAAERRRYNATIAARAALAPTGEGEPE